ncbi:MAG: ABC transporter permease [Clostridia bacterium]|nr:ABC transporter permease [Clostridia bacterium]
MSSYEKQEIAQLPDKYRPLGAWGYFGYTLLFSIPVVGFICLIIFACSGSNINRRSFARSYFCGLILVAIVIGIIVIAGGGFAAIMEALGRIGAGG